MTMKVCAPWWLMLVHDIKAVIVHISIILHESQSTGCNYTMLDRENRAVTLG